MNQQENSNSISPNYFFEVSFDGTRYQGWQSQPHGNSVQQVLENAIHQLFVDNSIKINGSGRTDAGVHAIGMGVTFKAPLKPIISEEKIKVALNGLLPGDITIKTVKKINSDFHARYSAIGKIYTYVINRGIETPFNFKYSWKRQGFNKICELRQATKYLVGEHDFSAFTVKRKSYDNAVRTIYRIDIQEFEELCCISFIGNGFLYKMVRSMVGALEKVATSRLTPEDIKTILLSKDRANSEATCPAKGLFLTKVFYNENELKQFILDKPPFYF